MMSFVYGFMEADHFPICHLTLIHFRLPIANCRFKRVNLQVGKGAKRSAPPLQRSVINVSVLQDYLDGVCIRSQRLHKESSVF